MKKWIKNNKALFAGILIAAVGLIGALANEFLFKADPGGITGMEALKQAGANFWVWAIVLSVVAGGAVYGITRYLKKEGTGSLSMLIVPIVFLAIAWGKGCTEKADRGVGFEHHVPIPQTDSTRISADSMIKLQKEIKK